MRQIIAAPYGYSLRYKHGSVSPVWRGCRPEQDYKLSSPGVYTYPRPPNAFYDDVILIYTLLYYDNRARIYQRRMHTEEMLLVIRMHVYVWMYLTLLRESSHMHFLPVREIYVPEKD